MTSTSHVSIIAKPLADPKQTRSLLRLTKKCAKESCVKRGIKEVVKTIRRGGTTNCVVLIAGDISPIDVLSHLPVLCEENSIPYIWVPSKEKLGHSSKTKRATSCVMLVQPKDGSAARGKYDELVGSVFKSI